jgi:hypothetical protein
VQADPIPCHLLENLSEDQQLMEMILIDTVLLDSALIWMRMLTTHHAWYTSLVMCPYSRGPAPDQRSRSHLCTEESVCILEYTDNFKDEKNNSNNIKSKDSFSTDKQWQAHD